MHLSRKKITSLQSLLRTCLFVDTECKPLLQEILNTHCSVNIGLHKFFIQIRFIFKQCVLSQGRCSSVSFITLDL